MFLSLIKEWYWSVLIDKYYPSKYRLNFVDQRTKRNVLKIFANENRYLYEVVFNLLLKRESRYMANIKLISALEKCWNSKFKRG